MSDTEFYARGEAVANEHALFLVGNAKSNRVVRELEPGCRSGSKGSDVVLGNETRVAEKWHAGPVQLGVAFIRPNPKRTDRYVVVVEGVGPLGTWRSLSLPTCCQTSSSSTRTCARARRPLARRGDRACRRLLHNDWALPADPERVINQRMPRSASRSPSRCTSPSLLTTATDVRADEQSTIKHYGDHPATSSRRSRTPFSGSATRSTKITGSAWVSAELPHRRRLRAEHQRQRRGRRGVRLRARRPGLVLVPVVLQWNFW